MYTMTCHRSAAIICYPYLIANSWQHSKFAIIVTISVNYKILILVWSFQRRRRNQSHVNFIILHHSMYTDNAVTQWWHHFTCRWHAVLLASPQSGYNISSKDAISSLWAFMSIWLAICKWWCYSNDGQDIQYYYTHIQYALSNTRGQLWFNYDRTSYLRLGEVTVY